MCGISPAVLDTFKKLEEFNHKSSMVLRSWTKLSLSQKRTQHKDLRERIKREIACRGSPSSGAVGKRGVKGSKDQQQLKSLSLHDLKQRLQDVGANVDHITFIMQEGKWLVPPVGSTGKSDVKRPHHGLPMFVGLLVTGFKGDWITQDSCITCSKAHEIARCCWCQCGICEDCGELVSRASQKGGEWKGASTACCGDVNGCRKRTQEIKLFWRTQTGEDIE